MNKGLGETDTNNPLDIKTKSPIHLHISQDAPVHLHFERAPIHSHIVGTRTNVNKSKMNIPHYQVPWIPPPAKTSSGRPLIECTRNKVTAKPVSETEVANQVDCAPGREHEDAYSGETREATSRGMSIIPERTCESSRGRLREKSPAYESVKSRLAGQPMNIGDQSERKNIDVDLEDGALWTAGVADEWIMDIDNSMTHVARAVRKLEEILEELSYEGRRLSNQDVRRITEPRDELILQAEVAVRAGRELCRWASSARQQQDQCLLRRLQQTQSREAALTAEVRQLHEKLDHTMIELEATRRQLNAQKDESMKFNTVNESLESVKAHLQRELRMKDSECDRLSIQLRTVNSRLAQERATLRTRLEAAEAAMEQLRETKEAIKRAARSQKRRAERAEQELANALQKLAAKESMLDQFNTNIDKVELMRASRTDRNDRCDNDDDDDDVDEQEEDENERVSRRGLSRAATRQSNTGASLSRDTSLNNQSPEKRKSQKQLEQENDRLRAAAVSCEERLMLAEKEMEQLRSTLSTYEHTENTYKGNSHNQAEHLLEVTEQLKKAEQARIRGEQQLAEIEARLQEAEAQNRALMDALEQSGVRPSSGIKLSRESARELASILKKQEAGQDQASVLKELQRQLSEARSERETAERRAEVRLADLRAQLTQADATNRSLQAYLTFLKRSYASVFQPELTSVTSNAYGSVPLLTKSATTTNNVINTGTGGPGVGVDMETPNLSGLSPQVLPTDKHRC